MVNFVRYENTGLYVSDGNIVGKGWWGFVLTTPPPESPAGPVSLSAALTNETWQGSLVYVASEYDAISDNASDFIAAVKALIENNRNNGAIVFLPSGIPSKITPTNHNGDQLPDEPKVMALNRYGTKIVPATFNIRLTGQSSAGILLNLNNGVTLSVPEDANENYIWFSPTGANRAAIFGGALASSQQPEPTDLYMKLWVSGANAGIMEFESRIQESALTPVMNMGFQVVIPNPEHGTQGGHEALEWLSGFFPLAEISNTSPTSVNFIARINIMNPNNLLTDAVESGLYFTGENGPGSTMPTTIFNSFYRTNFGKVVTLTPDASSSVLPRLVINPGTIQTPLQQGFRFSPVGDFVMGVVGADNSDHRKLICGVSGTETVAFLPEVEGKQSGERLRFIGNQPGHAPQLPLQAVSPVGPPLEQDAKLLTSTHMTSWASVVAPPDDSDRQVHYSAAPKGAELFGKGTSKADGLFGPEEPGVALPAQDGPVFPLLPVAGFTAGSGIQDMTLPELEQLARQIISPTRKSLIDEGGVVPSASAASALTASAAPDGDGLTSTTTPAGFITRYSGGSWKQLLLSQVQNDEGSITRQMGFTALTKELQAGFQTNDQFLVVANDKYLGEFQKITKSVDSGVFMPPADNDVTAGPRFYNNINIGQWNFTAETGRQNSFGDYRSVVLVKGVKGKIFEPDANGNATDHSLVRSPDKWTMRDQFASPGAEKAPHEPDPSQLVPLSTFLVEYCEDAWSKRDNPYFANFAKIISDENWTGVLILKAEIADVPADLAGILAGVKDPSLFFAHHIGIEIGQIEKDKVQQKDSTSMFGLVYYVDPRYDDSEAPHTIPAQDPAQPYDFTLLTLKALFENSAIKKFESLAQMVLNNMFGSTVSSMYDIIDGSRQVNLNNAVLLEGGVQKNDGAVLYSLGSKWPNQFWLDNNVLTHVEIDTAQMSTRDSGSDGDDIVSWISMSGFMNFAVIPGQEATENQAALPAFDIFSYGPEPDDNAKTTLRTGLNFNNLGLKIEMPDTVVGEGSAPDPTLSLIENEIAFNSAGSTPRKASLFKSFQLELQGLYSGDASSEDEAGRSDPNKLGFATVATQYELQGVTSGSWHGLRFKLNLGTPGALAGKVNLSSSLMVAWADNSGQGGGDPGYSAMIGVELPGAGSGGELFSLQTVIKLSVGVMQLFYTEGSDGKQGGFMLVLNQIALKLLGLLKIPPSGNTAFMLFGDENVTDTSGLGWFAVYNRAKEEKKKSSELESAGE